MEDKRIDLAKDFKRVYSIPIEDAMFYIKRHFPDQQPNDVEAVKPIGYAGKAGSEYVRVDVDYVGNLYSRQTVDQLQEKIAELEKENKYISEINHSVSVCANHTDEITTQDDCMICTITDTEAKLKEAEKALEDITKHQSAIGDGMVQLSATYRIAQSALDTIRKEQGDADKS